MKHKEFFAMAGIMAVAIFFRFFLIGQLPPGLYPDEAMNGNNAHEALVRGDFKVFYQDNNGREGLFINLQALSLWLLGNHAWALRLVSAIFGTLTALAVYLLGREWLGRRIGLAAAFFLATSYWHINFSRIGFRAITVPFFATFALYFLWKGLRQQKITDLIAAGLFIGLGFYTYIAFRFMVLVLVAPALWFLVRWAREGRLGKGGVLQPVSDARLHGCTPCALMLIFLVIVVSAFPIGLYFLQNPGDFFGRGGQVSVFSASSPLLEFLKSAGAAIAMLYVVGDCNFRHNFACLPQLHPVVALFFTVGMVGIVGVLRKKSPLSGQPKPQQALAQGVSQQKIIGSMLLIWLGAMMLPAALTREGIPHALRSIGMIPPIMIIAGWGAERARESLARWIARKKTAMPVYARQLDRIKKELVALWLLMLLSVPLATAYIYFVRMPRDSRSFFAFSADNLHLGEYLASLPDDVRKIVVINEHLDPRIVSISAQTILFVTNTFLPEERARRHIYYVNPRDLGAMAQSGMASSATTDRMAISFLNPSDYGAMRAAKQQFPALQLEIHDDFVLLVNY